MPLDGGDAASRRIGVDHRDCDGPRGGAAGHTAVASSQTPDPDTSNNTGTATVTVTPSADLAIVKTISANPAPLNGAVTYYTIVVTNNGPSVASAVTVADALPPGC